MGCDIHANVAWDEYGEDQWEPVVWYGKIHLPRNYRMFGALVNGHSRYPDDSAAPEARGLLPLWRNEDGSLGDHTFSWMTLAELDAAILRAEADTGGGKWHEYRAVAEMMRELERSGKPTRFVFGFDS